MKRLFCRKSLLKACTWRFTATSITALCSYVITNDFVFTAKITSADFLLKLIAYYCHEIIWEKRI